MVKGSTELDSESMFGTFLEQEKSEKILFFFDLSWPAGQALLEVGEAMNQCCEAQHSFVCCLERD